MCPKLAFCLSLVGAVTPPLFSPSLLLLLCPNQTISVLYLEPRRYRTLQLALCDSILTDLRLSKQSPHFCFAHFLLSYTPSLFLSHISHQCLSLLLPFWFSICVFNILIAPVPSSLIMIFFSFHLSTFSLHNLPLCTGVVICVSASSRHPIRYIVHNPRVSSLWENLCWSKHRTTQLLIREETSNYLLLHPWIFVWRQP